MRLGWAVFAFAFAAQENPSATESFHLVVVQRKRRDAFTRKSLAVYPNSVAIRNVAHMVRVLEREVRRTGTQIGSLHIVGHASEDGQRFGGDWISLDSLEFHRRELVRLKDLFAPEAIVALGGCRVGRNQELLVAQSELWGVDVLAMYENQHSPEGFEGPGRVCRQDECTRLEEGALDTLYRLRFHDSPP